MNIGDKIKHKYSDREAVIVDTMEGVNRLIIVEWLGSDNYRIALPPSYFYTLDEIK